MIPNPDSMFSGKLQENIPPAAISPEIRVITGSHRNSVKSVASGNAQIAAIDAVAFELSRRYDPELTSNVTVIGHSMPKPGLPLITSPANKTHVKSLYGAIESAIDKAPASVLETLLIKGIEPAADPDYEVFL